MKYFISSVTLATQLNLRKLTKGITVYALATLAVVVAIMIFVCVRVYKFIGSIQTRADLKDLFCTVTDPTFVPPSWVLWIQYTQMTSLAIFFLFWTLTIGGILFSLLKVRDYIRKRGLNQFNGRMMVLHCFFFMGNYASILVASLSLILATHTGITISESADYSLLFHRLLMCQIANICVQITNTMSRPLIFFVFLKFANQCRVISHISAREQQEQQ